MLFSKTSLYSLLFTLICSISFISAEEAKNPQHCQCGCACGPGCDCGCSASNPCKCNPPRKMTVCKMKDCKCGCAEGKACSCPKPKVDCPCKMADCKCGCAEGKACSCPKPKVDCPCKMTDCTCGCAEGESCTCNKSEENNSCEMSNCTCGCADGGECQCNSSECSCCPDWDNDNSTGCPICDDCHDASREYPWGPINPCEYDTFWARQCGLWGVWMPEDPPLFRQFAADPRQVTYSVGWRFNDQALDKNVIDVSYGDSLPIYRFIDVWPYNGSLQLDIEGALWAVFSPYKESAPLINADYYVGFPLTYAFDCWSFRLRGYHISSHIGDEFLLDHPGFDRRNPSAEYIDFFVSYELTDEIRVYDGLGWIIFQDESFHVGSFYAEAGLELRLRRLGFTDDCNQIYGEPIFAMHFRGRSDFKNHVDSTYILGYELGKLDGLRRKVRLFMEYHDGYSVEGQFCRKATNYFAFRASYGF